MEYYPPLLGLSLAPRETSAAPDGSDAPGGSDLQKHDSTVYRQRLKTWKSTDTLKERWYEHTYRQGGEDVAREYFEDDERFYSDWIPVAQQESYFYEKRDEDDGKLVDVMHPAQMILRVAADSMQISVEELAQRNTWIVDGSNMIDANTSRIDIWKQIKANQIADGYAADHAIIVCKAEGMSTFKNGQPIQDEDGEPLDPEVTFNSKYFGYGRFWDWMQHLAPPDKIFLVVVEDWVHHATHRVVWQGKIYGPGRSKLVGDRKRTICGQDSSESNPPSKVDWRHPGTETPGYIEKEELDGLDFEHYKCEYDDTLCITLRQLLEFHKAAAPRAAAAAAAAAAAPPPRRMLGEETFGPRFQDPWTEEPTLSSGDWGNWKYREGQKWRQSPAFGVVTDDLQIWDNLYPDALAKSFKQLLKFSDVFRIRIFMPLNRQGPSGRDVDAYTYPEFSTSPSPLSVAINNINDSRFFRYIHDADYMFSEAQKPFYNLVLHGVNLAQDVLFDSTSAGNPQKLAQVDPAPVNWAYTNMILNTAPAGWGEANYRSAEEIVQRRRSVVAKALGVSMATQLEEGYKVWSQTAFSES